MTLDLLAVLATATLVGVVATGLARALALRTGFVNHPNPIVPDHTTPIAYLGGAGIAAGAAAGGAAAVAAGAIVDPIPPGLLVGAIGLLMVGLYDDLRALGAGTKLVLEAGVVGLALLAGGLTPTITGAVALDAAFAALWILAVVNGFNFIDVLDGLAGSVAVVSLALFGLVFGLQPGPTVALAGGTLGFLVWNRPPARVFMGDAGSLCLGFVLATYALSAPAGDAPLPYLAAIPLFVALPWFDLFFQTLVRMAQGRRWWVAGPDSFALHLRASGLGKPAVVAIACLVAAGLWLTGAVLPKLDPPYQAATLLGVLAFGALAWRQLLRWPVIPTHSAPSPEELS
jgi:UDP-GlcNAc:undecaprenyl-phosphate GlcNAc-1-phosphate transferase